MSHILVSNDKQLNEGVNLIDIHGVLRHQIDIILGDSVMWNFIHYRKGIKYYNHFRII